MEQQPHNPTRAEHLKKMTQIGEEILNTHPDEEEYWALNHWVNNPLITPKNKVANYDKHLQSERNQTFNETLTLIRNHIYNPAAQNCSCGENQTALETYNQWENHIREKHNDS